MKPLTAEWASKAEGDYTSACRELRARRAPNYDAACFHAQQSAEKYFKACLQQANIPFGKTHDLAYLLDQLLPIELEWECLRDDLHELTAFGVDFRYPGRSADKELARAAVSRCTKLRHLARQRLGLGISESRVPSAAKSRQKKAARRPRRKGK